MPDEEYHLRLHIEIVCYQEVSSTPRPNAGVFRSVLLYGYCNTRLAPRQYRIHSQRTARGSSRPSLLNNSTIQYSHTAAIPLQCRFNSMSPSDLTDAWKLSLLFTLPRRALRYPARNRATRLCLCKGFVQGGERRHSKPRRQLLLCAVWRRPCTEGRLTDTALSVQDSEVWMPPHTARSVTAALLRPMAAPAPTLVKTK